ncbi:hypothetical protein BH24CHL6_BH24CHL6_04870 [soil metagenome]
MPRIPQIPLVASVLALAAILAGCAGPTPTPTPAAGDSLHAFPALEARLPSAVDGHEMEKVSIAAPESQQDPKTLEVVRRVGRTAADLQVAIATAAGANLQVGAFRIVGAEAVQIVVAFQAVEEEGPASSASYGMATIGGKRLLTRTVEAQLTYLYPAEDIMFMLSGEPGLVEEALGQLP